MKNLFEIIQKRNIYNEPFDYIYWENVVEVEEYDKLYENMHYFNGNVWTEWKTKYDLFHGKLLYDVQALSYDNECIALWFFTDRNDRGLKKDIELYSPTNSKRINRSANTFLFFKLSKEQQIKISPPIKEHKFLRPCIQFNFPANIFKRQVSDKFKNYDSI